MVRGTLTFISGGVRSGKSAYAEKILVDEAETNGGRLVYIASGTATDLEMENRIKKHQMDRSEFNWTTFEQPINLEEVLPQVQPDDLVLWDCLTTWLANELYEGWEKGTPCIAQVGCMEQKVEQLHKTIELILATASQLIIVSNEVLDDVPPIEEETEVYRQWLGEIHQQFVTRAQTTIEMECSIPIYWKKEDVR